MHISAPFIQRPVATSLLSFALLLAGAVAYSLLPVASLPDIDFPVISVNGGLPGASPETMASAVATPLERQFGRIAGINQMTSSSSLGSAGVTMQFDLNRNIDSAARDVQAAINAARSELPSYMPQNPGYRKTNPADSPVLILALTSEILSRPQIYDLADSILAQKISQIPGVGQVSVAGAASPAVRVELNPLQLASTGIGLEAIRVALSSANANRPKGSFQDANNRWQISANDQLFDSDKYANIVIGTSRSTGAPVRVADVATVVEGTADIRNAGMFGSNPVNGPPGKMENAVSLVIFKIPGVNIISTVDAVMKEMPRLQAAIPSTVKINIAVDRTTTIRSSVRDVEITLLASVLLVVLVVFFFLREIWSTIIPSIAVPLSLVGAFGVMYMLGYTIDNLSLMALTISTGFVVDDAIVVIENITRYLEMGDDPYTAAMKGSREIGFTVLSMSTSLIAVFIPILLMGGIVGKLFREFAMTLCIAIAVSMLVSLTTTPMLCARFLKTHDTSRHSLLYRVCGRIVQWLRDEYALGLRWVLNHQYIVFGILLATVGLNGFLIYKVPKGFFPQQDTGRLGGRTIGSQDISFRSMQDKQAQLAQMVLDDPAVRSVTSSQNGTNSAQMFVSLKPQAQRPGKISSDLVVNRLRRKLTSIPGATLYLQTQQDLQVGARSSASQFQFTLSDENLQELYTWAPLLAARARELPELRDVTTDQQNKGLSATLVIDRDAAARLGVSMSSIDQVLYDAFGQRRVSTMYTGLNQYFVVMEVDPQFSASPDALNGIFVRASTSKSTSSAINSATTTTTAAAPTSMRVSASTSTPAGAMVPLSYLAHFEPQRTSLQVHHQGQYPSITLTFNLAPNVALGDAVAAIRRLQDEMAMPQSLHATFQGTAQAFQDSLANELWLVIAAIVAVYIVLGILYESLIHPLTILSTIPPAGLGAVLALMMTGTEFTIIALIGVLLLVGIVKKNAILMIDFALQAERDQGMAPIDAIYYSCMLRFRPIMMTTMAALFGGLPLALGMGVGSELRKPLGITIVGGLVVSQLLTLFTTPVVYLLFDKLQWKFMKLHRIGSELEEAPGD